MIFNNKCKFIKTSTLLYKIYNNNNNKKFLKYLKINILQKNLFCSINQESNILNKVKNHI